MTDTIPKLITIQKGQDSLWRTLKTLWDQRELLIILASREVALRYRQTALGVLWVIIQPLLASAVFTIIFGILLNVPHDNNNYTLFAFAGLLPWGIFSQSVQKASLSLLREIRLITKIFFPRIIIPVATILATLVDFAVSLVVLLVLMLVFQIPFSLSLLFIIPLLLVTLMFSVGIGIIFASINVFFRDFTYITPFLVQVWMYASPLAYSEKLIPSGWQWVYDINPMVGIISGFRWAVFGGVEFPIKSFEYSLIVSIFAFVGGILYFNRFERKFADVI